MDKEERLGMVTNARTAEQRGHMTATLGKGECPFCKVDEKINKIIKEGVYWRMWHNPFPYPHHRQHIVIASIKHINQLSKIPPQIGWELIEFLAWAEKEFGIPGGAFVMRFGSLEYNAGTLTHLHAHIQVPDLTGPAMVVLKKIDPSQKESDTKEIITAFTQGA